MLIGHLSDLHLRDADDVLALERQLDLIAARHPAHLAVTGDLLDRWNPRLLERALDAFAARGLLAADRLTILHGNHDLASSGGHPRQRADLVRLALRFWDPPPLVHARRRRFYAAIERRAPGVGRPAPFVKRVSAGARIAVVDTVPVPWRPLRLGRGVVTVQHALGCLRPRQLEWLSAQRGDAPLIVLLHHYPLEAPQFRWTSSGLVRRIVGDVHVPMWIPERERERFWDAARAAAASLVLCGHVHRTRLDWKDGIGVGLNGQSGAEWAGRTIAYYEITPDGVRTETTTPASRSARRASAPRN
ncbi:MAG TPA: metallophosphoesterase [Vicinamibacterales bacterium]|nr:metallophosphoesterase [Vicinamibacterales bacterium]